MQSSSFETLIQVTKKHKAIKVNFNLYSMKPPIDLFRLNTFNSLHFAYKQKLDLFHGLLLCIKKA